MHRPYVAPAIITLAVAVLYGWFLYNPIVFDDMYFFLPGVPERFIETASLHTRVLGYATLSLGSRLLGNSLLGFRVASLLLHAGVAITLYFFLRQLQQTNRDGKTGPAALALLAALAFALHPAAVYGAAYLVQRTTVMATLFALLSWVCVLRGLQAGQRKWLWASVGAYALAVLSKEHAIMVPAVSAALAVWWWRTQPGKQTAVQLFRSLLPTMVGSCAIAVLVVLQLRGLLGGVYELDAPEMLPTISVEHAWPLSILTQSSLFFKYLLLWLLPNPMWMSVDMREPFAQSLAAWPALIGLLAFVIWPVIAAWLLWKGGRRGLLGFAMLAPWLLFATELTTVRIQEIFVLYRSYLWLAPAFCAALALEPLLKPRTQLALLGIVPLLLFPLAWERLTTFSHPLLLWDDAERLVHDRDGLPGLERIYRNRGIALYKVAKYELAIEDYTKAILFKPEMSYAYNDRGAALLQLKRYAEALNDFDVSLRLKAGNVRSLAGRGTALEALGRMDEAKESYRSACALGWPAACAKVSQ